MSYEIKKLDQSHFDNLIELYHDCFSKKVTQKYFRWKYMECPYGKVIGFTMHSDNNLAGFYGILPEKYLISNEKFKIYQSMDTMTHSSHMKKGIFTKLAKVTYDEAIKNDNTLNILAFVGLNSFPGFVRKLDFTHVGEVKKIYLLSFILKIICLVSSNNSLEFVRVSNFDEIIDNYFKNKDRYYKIEKDMSSKFLNWRIFNHPIYKYNAKYIYCNKDLIGFYVYRVINDKSISLEYVDFKKNDYYSNLRYILQDIINESGVKIIETYQPSNLNIRANFKKIGFFRSFLSRGPFSDIVSFVFNDFNYNNLSKTSINHFNLQPLVRD